MKIQPVDDFLRLTHRAVDWSCTSTNGIPSDLEGAMHLFNIGLKHESFSYIPLRKPLDITEVRQRWMKEEPAVSHWVSINENQEVIASAHIGEYECQGKVRCLHLNIIVHPSYQGKGVGTILCNLIIQAVLQNYEQLHIFTKQENQPMVALGRKLQKNYHVHETITKENKLKFIVTKPKVHPV